MVITRRVSNGHKRTTDTSPRKMIIQNTSGKEGKRRSGDLRPRKDHGQRICRCCSGILANDFYNSAVCGNDSSSHSLGGKNY